MAWSPEAREAAAAARAQKGGQQQPQPAHQQGVNQVGTMPPESDESRELRLFADNDSNLYRQSTTPVMQNLQKKYDADTYDPDKAKTLYGYHADRAAQAYAKEFGGPGQKWHQMFSPEVRREAAAHWESENRSEFANGNWRK